MSKRLRSAVKKNLGALVGLTLYFVLAINFGIPGLESDAEVAVPLTLAGALLAYLASYFLAAKFIKSFDRLAGSSR